jgi:hypothetical protein
MFTPLGGIGNIGRVGRVSRKPLSSGGGGGGPIILDFENNAFDASLIGSKGQYTYSAANMVPGVGGGLKGSPTLGSRLALLGAAEAAILAGAVVVLDCTCSTNDQSALMLTNAGVKNSDLRFFRGASQQGIQDDWGGAIDVAAREFGGSFGRIKYACRTTFDNLGWAVHSFNGSFGIKHEGFTPTSPDIGVPDMVGIKVLNGPTTGILHSIKIYPATADLLTIMDA